MGHRGGSPSTAAGGSAARPSNFAKRSQFPFSTTPIDPFCKTKPIRPAGQSAGFSRQTKPTRLAEPADGPTDQFCETKPICAQARGGGP
jgi:hypothetical protein